MNRVFKILSPNNRAAGIQYLSWTLIASILSVLLSLASLVLPHEAVSTSSVLNNSVQLFLFVLSIFIIRREPTKRTKLIFINFCTFFGISILFHLYNFIPDDGGLTRFFFFQYVGIIGYYFALTFSIAYVTFDQLATNLKFGQKYLLVFVVVGGCFVYYHYPFLSDPRHVYSTADAKDLEMLRATLEEMRGHLGQAPTAQDLASVINLPNHDQEFSSDKLPMSANLARIVQLLPFLVGENNYVVLYVRPLYVTTVQMCVVALGFIILFFGYQYAKDPPQGAYIEKMMFLFLIFVTMEILHAWSYVKSVEWASFYEIMNAGQVISVGILLLIGLVMVLRLRFITSPKGQFYEREIIENPAGITRWRDAVDDLMLHYFFNRKTVLGRLFADRRNSP